MTTIPPRDAKLPSDETRHFCIEIPESHANDLIRFIYALGQNYAWRGEQWLREQSSKIFRDLVSNMACQCGCESVYECLSEQDGINTIIDILADNGRDTIIKLLSDAGVIPFPERPIDPIPSPELPEPIEPLPSCDYDKLYGGLRNITSFIVDGTLNFWQWLDVESRDATWISKLIGAIPLLETLPIDELVAVKDWLVDEVVDSFNAYDSAEARDAIACKMFTIIKCAQPSRCDVSWNDMADALLELSGESVIPSNVQELWDLFNGIMFGNIPSSLVYHVSLLIAVSSWRLAGSFVSVPQRNIGFLLALGYDQPSSDWQLLCEACVNPVIVEYDFTQGQGIWRIADNQPRFGTYIAGVGYQSVSPTVATNDQELRLQAIGLSVPNECVAMEIDVITPNVPNPNLYRTTTNPLPSGAIITFPQFTNNSNVYTIRVNFATRAFSGNWRLDHYIVNALPANRIVFKAIRYMRI